MRVIFPPVKKQFERVESARTLPRIGLARAAQAELAALVYRGEGIEAMHYASIAVVDGTGQLTRYLGDPDLTIMARSTIKPFQVLPLLLTGAYQKYGFSLRQLAIMCGSHSGTDEHREVVLQNLKLSGHGPEDLQCGVHWPLGMQAAGQYPANGEDRDPLRHNCSGKHTGFLALARFLGDDTGDYLNPAGRAQTMVSKIVSDFLEFPIEQMSTAVDGCSAPNTRIALRNLAFGFVKLATGRAADPALKDALGTVREAMQSHPEMVSGEKRFDLALMRSYPDKVVCKVGAEAIEGIGFSEPPLGIAVKVHDGSDRALGPVCIEVLRQLGLVKSLDSFPHLRKYEAPEVRNARGTVTGHVVADFKLRGV